MRTGGVTLGSYHLVSLVCLSLSCFRVCGADRIIAAGFSKQLLFVSMATVLLESHRVASLGVVHVFSG